MICLVGAGGKPLQCSGLRKSFQMKGKKFLHNYYAIRCPSRDQHDRIVIADSVLPDFSGTQSTAV